MKIIILLFLSLFDLGIFYQENFKNYTFNKSTKHINNHTTCVTQIAHKYM